MNTAANMEKIVLSGGYGNRTNEQLIAIKKHLSKLLQSLVKDSDGTVQEFVMTQCKKPNALFKTKKNKVVGLKLTLRKDRAKKLLNHFQKTLINFKDSLTYNNSTLFYGLKDHRLLKLQRYNYAAPQYGFNLAIVYTKPMNRVYNRRYRVCLKKRKSVPEADCRLAIAKDLVQ